MSYCRFMEGDVYMYPSTMGGIECCNCLLHEDEWGSVSLKDEKEALEHLNEHVKAGHKVPKRAFEELEREINERDKQT